MTKINKIVKVKLPIPFEKDGNKVSTLELRKPYAGDLRGLTLTGVCQMDFSAACTLLPRISNLNERDMLNIETENLTVLMVEMASFFVNTKR